MLLVKGLAEDKQGNALAVKIQYPNVQKSIESDLSLLKTIAASFLRKFDLNEHLDEMKLRLIEETDYMREGENLVRFSKTFSFSCGLSYTFFRKR